MKCRLVCENLIFAIAKRRVQINCIADLHQNFHYEDSSVVQLLKTKVSGLQPSSVFVYSPACFSLVEKLLRLFFFPDEAQNKNTS